MLFTIMRYRTGKFGIQAIESAKNGKRVNNDREILDYKGKFGRRCSEYRIDEKNGVVHIWTFDDVIKVTNAIQSLDVPSVDNDEPTES